MSGILRTILVIALVLGLAGAVAIGCGDSEQETATKTPTTVATKTATPKATYNWKFSQPYPEGTKLYELAEDFMSRVEQASGGRITFTHYPGDLLGDYVTVQESVKKGDVDFALTWPVESVFGPVMGAQYLGFVFRDYDDAREAQQIGGWFNDLVLAPAFEQGDVKLLGSTTSGFISILSKKEFDPVPGTKDVKIRVPLMKMFELRYEALGFQIVSLPMSEVPVAMKLGTIDARSGATAEEAWMERDLYTYMYKITAVTLPTPCIMNLDLFDSLSAEDQQILLSVGEEWTTYAWPEYEKAIAQYEKDLADAGIEVIELTDQQWNACAKASRAVEWPYAEEAIGKEVMDILRANAVDVD